MAPTTPYFRSPRGHCAAAAAAITISSSSSSGSDQSFTNTLVILSSASATCSRSVAIVPDSSASRGGDEARGGQRSGSRYRRSVVPVRSPTVITAASFANGSGADATSRRTAVAPHQCPSPRSVLSVRAPGGVALAPAPDRGGGDEATSRLKRKLRYRLWDVDDERKVLTTLAKLRRDNLGVFPQASVLLRKICADGGLRRCGVDATELSDKVYKLKKKFEKAAAKVAASGGRRLRKYRNQVLYKISMELWSDVLPVGVAAAVLVQGGQN